MASQTLQNHTALVPPTDLVVAAIQRYRPLFEADTRLDAWRRFPRLLREVRHEEAALALCCYMGRGEYSLEMPPNEYVDHLLAFDLLFPALAVRVLPGYWLAECLGARELMRLITLPHFAYLGAPLPLVQPSVPLPPAYAAAALHRALVFEPDAFDALRASHPDSVLFFWDNFDLAPIAERLYGPNLDWGGWQCLWLFALRNGHSALFSRLRSIHGDETLAGVLAESRPNTIHCLTGPAHPEQLRWVLEHLPAALESVTWRLGPVRRPKPLQEYLAKLRDSAQAFEPSPLSCCDGHIRCVPEHTSNLGELAEKLADRSALHLLARFAGAAEAIVAALDRRPAEQSRLLAAIAKGLAYGGSHCDHLLANDLLALRDYFRDSFAPLSLPSIFVLNSDAVYDYLESLDSVEQL